MAEGDSKLGILITVFIFIVVGIALINVLGDAIFENVNLFTTTNETVDITALRQTIEWNDSLGVLWVGNMTDGSTISLANDRLDAITQVRTGNETILIEGIDFTLDKTSGLITFRDTISLARANETDNYTSWDYTHGENYVRGSSVARTFINLIMIFFVVGFVLFVISKIFDIDLFNMFGGK